jgi:hypothetical protein
VARPWPCVGREGRRCRCRTCGADVGAPHGAELRAARETSKGAPAALVASIGHQQGRVALEQLEEGVEHLQASEAVRLWVAIHRYHQYSKKSKYRAAEGTCSAAKGKWSCQR